MSWPSAVIDVPSLLIIFIYVYEAQILVRIYETRLGNRYDCLVLVLFLPILFFLLFSEMTFTAPQCFCGVSCGNIVVRLPTHLVSVLDM